MTALPILVADHVATSLNTAAAAESFSLLGWRAERRYFDWDADYRDLKDLRVEVVFGTAQPKGTIALASQETLEYDVAIDIVIRKRFDQNDREETSEGRLRTEAVDPLVDLLQEIHEKFISERGGFSLDGSSDASWNESDVMSWVSQAKLRKGLFEGVVRVKFRAYRSV